VALLCADQLSDCAHRCVRPKMKCISLSELGEGQEMSLILAELDVSCSRHPADAAERTKREEGRPKLEVTDSQPVSCSVAALSDLVTQRMSLHQLGKHGIDTFRELLSDN
jgi:hypothetical protein